MLFSNTGYEIDPSDLVIIFLKQLDYFYFTLNLGNYLFLARKTVLMIQLLELKYYFNKICLHINGKNIHTLHSE